MKRLSIIAAALLPIVAISGCGIGALRERQTRLCEQLVTLKGKVEMVKTARANASVEQLKQAEFQISEVYKNFRAMAQETEATTQDTPQMDLESTVGELDKAQQDLNTKIQKMPEKTMTGQVLTTIDNKVATLETALVKAKSGLRCSQN